MKPNVILFIVDQLAAKWFEAARDENICALPNLDWLLESTRADHELLRAQP